MIDRLEQFDIRNFKERLTILKEESSQLICECPVCGGHRLTIHKETGKYQCWSGGCECKNIRGAIAPLPNQGDAPRRQTPQGIPVQKPKSPVPPNTDVHLAKLLTPVTDTPQAQKDFDPNIGEILKTTYVYSSTPEGQLERWVVRTDWADPNKPKGRDKTFRQWHCTSSGEAVCKKGDTPWEAYQINEFIQALKSTPGIAAGLVQEGEKGVEVSRANMIASTTFQGSAWKVEDLERTLIRVKEECPNAVLVFLRDNDTPGEKKARDFQETCNRVGIFSVVIDPLVIYSNLPHKGDIVEILEEMNTPEFIRRLEAELHRGVEGARRDSEPEVVDTSLDTFDPNVEFVQKVRRDLYGDKPWICVDGILHYWTGNHYKPSSDVVEMQRLWHYCNGYAVENSKGEIGFPYASPSAVKKSLEWVKLAYGIDPTLVNPPGLNVSNGVVQVTWVDDKPSVKLVNHDPEMYYIYEPVATYDPGADPTHCNRLLEVLDPPQREIFLRTIGASLDLAAVRKYKGRLVRGLLLKGDGNNGKDSLREAVSAMYGSQGMTGCTLSDFKAYDEGRKFPLSRLKKSRINWATENANTTALDKLQSVKAFLTGDTLSSEGKGKDELDYTPAAVGLFNVNDTPNLKGTLEAITSRWGVLSFNKTFKIGADPIKGEVEADPKFKYDPGFMRSHVLPAFLNRVLQALIDLMREGIDYTCTRKALEDIQRENCHLFQFCQDTGLQYEPTSTLLASEMWDLLEQWYQDNGTLSYEEGSNGKRKATWNEQPRKSDPNVKAVNQVIARFTVLFPKAKVVTVAKEGGGKPRMGLQGIGFVTTISPDPSPDFTQFITQVSPNLSPKESLQDKDFHPSHPISHDCGEKNKTNDESTTCPPETSLSSPNSEEMAKLGDLGEKADQVSNFGCSTGCKSGDATSELGDGSGEASVFKVSDRVRVHCPGSQRDDKTGVVQQIQNDGIHAIVWLDDASIRHDLRRWECHLSWLEVLRE